MASRTTKITIGAIALASTLGLLVFLNASLQPYKKPPKLPFADVSKLTPGQALRVNTESLHYFVVHPIAGELHVVAAPAQAGAILMPELHWWKPKMNCFEFLIEAAQGAIDRHSRFRCRDANQPKEWADRWQWDMEGKHIADGRAAIDNMYSVRFERDGDRIVFTALISP
jgi:hypothetical protein